MLTKTSRINIKKNMAEQKKSPENVNGNDYKQKVIKSLKEGKQDKTIYEIVCIL